MAPGTSAGDLDRKITIQRATEVPNEFNEPVLTWADFMSNWSAKREDVSERQQTEMIAAGQVGAFLVSRFTIRSSSEARTVTPKDHLIHEGATWSIHGVKEAAEGRRRFIQITAVKDAD